MKGRNLSQTDFAKQVKGRCRVTRDYEVNRHLSHLICASASFLNLEDEWATLIRLKSPKYHAL